MTTSTLQPLSPIVPFSSQLDSFNTLVSHGFAPPSPFVPTPTVAPNGSGADANTTLSSILKNDTTASTSIIPSIFSSLFSTRAVAIVLGLIAIAGAIFLFGASDFVSAVKKNPAILAG
jgi:hypothetical protein